MKRFLIVPVLALALAVAGCSGDSVFRGGTSITASVTTPVGKRELALVENTYAIAITTAIRYRDLGICKPGTVETLARPCARRDVLIVLQGYDRKAHAAIVTARNFIRDNPTISAVSAVNAARAAVSDFQTALSNSGAK
jgi:hypothetical protein